jgi:hypothetical protein
MLLGAVCMSYASMVTKEQISVRLDPIHLRLLQGLTPLYGTTKGEVARYLIVESLEEKHGLDALREKKAIK